MALIKCSECGQEISDMVQVCPKCGYQGQKNISDEIKELEKIIKLHKDSGWGDIIAGVIVLICIAVCLVVYAYASGRIDTMIAVTQSMIATAQSGEAKESASDSLEILMVFIRIIKAGHWIFIGLLGVTVFGCIWGAIKEWSRAKRINSITGRLKIFNDKIK